jgi:hypothetical protein
LSRRVKPRRVIHHDQSQESDFLQIRLRIRTLHEMALRGTTCDDQNEKFSNPNKEKRLT